MLKNKCNFGIYKNIKKYEELVSPVDLINKFEYNKNIIDLVNNSRRRIKKILDKKSDRLIVIIGPCSIHDVDSAIDYANLLLTQKIKYKRNLEIIMRTYFEKPRTTIGWKGLINDPYMNNSFKINDGLYNARKLLLKINNLNLPTATEYLDIMNSNYISDLISWGAIGARTTESQIHRELASGLSCPIGFKNNTDGNIKVAVDAIQASSKSHHFISMNYNGCSSIAVTNGNKYCHVILRGGKKPNYRSKYVNEACDYLKDVNLHMNVMIDASHANSEKKCENQVLVCDDICDQLYNGDRRIIGVMIESNIVSGRQDISEKLVYGQSITDSCIGWNNTLLIIEKLSNAVEKRRIRNI